MKTIDAMPNDKQVQLITLSTDTTIDKTTTDDVTFHQLLKRHRLNYCWY